MKYILISILLFFSAECFSQAIGGFIAPNNIAVMGADTAGNVIGKFGRTYILKPTNVVSPLSLANDSSIGWSGTQGDLLYFSSSSAVSLLPKSAVAGQVLTNGGTSNNPSWATPASSGWALLGNASTTVSNFLGTTDNIPMRFRINNIHSGKIDTVGKYGTSLGLLSLPDASTGASNTAMGYRACGAATSGFRLTAMGDQALSSATTASDITAIGFQAGAGATGAQNMFMGNFAGLSGAATNGNNMGFGYQSLQTTSTGAQNEMFGTIAGKSITTGSWNAGFGFGVLSASGATAAAQNSGFGNNSLAATTASDNSALGYRAGVTNTSGARNIFLGIHAGEYNTTRSDQLYVNSTDRGTDFADVTRSIIYGQQTSSLLTQYLTFNAKVGIHVNTPTSFLQLFRGKTVANSAPMKASRNIVLTTTAAAGSGGTATLTFATQTDAPFMIGDSITVAGVTPAGYNGSFVVTVVTATTIQYANATTGAQTVAGTITTPGTLANTVVDGNIEFDSTDFYYSSGTGSNLRRYYMDKVLKGSATLDFGNLVAIGCEDLTITVTGAADGDPVILGVPNASVVANSSYSAWVSSANTVSVRFCALVSGDPASGTFKVTVSK